MTVFERVIFILKNLYFRGIFLYFLVGIIYFLSVNHEVVRQKTLNHLQPLSFTYLTQGEGDGTFDRKKLKMYVRYYEKMMQYKPDNASARGVLGFCYYQLGETKKAIKSFKYALKYHPHSLWYFYNLGVIFYYEEDYAKAIEYLEKARMTGLEQNLAFLNYSTVLKPVVRDNISGDEQLNEIISKRYRQIHQLLMLIHYKLGDYEKVLSYAQLADNPYFGNKDFFYYYVGMALYQKGLYRKAIPLFQNTLKLNPQYFPAYNDLARSLEKVGQVTLAKKYFQYYTLFKNEVKEERLLEKDPFDVVVF